MRNLRSQSLIKKRRRRLFLRIFLFVLCLVVLVGIPALISRIPALIIREVEVKGAQGVPAEEIQTFVNKELQGNHFYIFPKANALLYSQKGLEKKILLTFPQIDAVNITLSSFHSTLIEIEEKKTASLWCGDTNTAKCFSMDKKGYIFEVGPTSSQSVYFIFHGFITEEPIGQYYLPQGTLEKLLPFIEGIRFLGIDPVSLSYIGEKEYEMKIKGGGKLLFIFEGNGEKVLSNLESLLEDKSFSVLEDGALTVSAIDLRYGNKIILKKN